MTTAELVDAGLVIFGIIVLPVIAHLFKTLRRLELENVELTQKISHIEGNYKQGIQHLNEEINEMKEDIKKLLKYAYLRARDEDTQVDL